MLRILPVLTLILISCKSEKQTEIAEVESNPIVEVPTVVTINEEFLLGTWQNIDDSEIDFLLHLNIDDNTVAGEYCSKAKHFFFEDCAMEDEGGYCSVRGRMEQLIITLETESCATYELGEASITRADSFLVWNLNKAPGPYAEKHLMPENMELKKISNTPFL